MADDKQNVISSMYKNLFIKIVISNSNQKPPNIVCYTDEQIEDIQNCMTSDSIIGIHRTFNLGSYFLTALLYQNFTLVRKGTETAHIPLGPVFLHWDGLYPPSFDFFLSKIRSAFQGFHIAVEKSVFGTDEELALVNAIKTNFSSSQHMYMVVKENTQRKLLNHNIPEEIRNRIISSLFDNTGLIHSDSRISYFERESEVLENFGHVGGKYLQDKLLPTLKEQIFLPSQSNHIIPPDWKNNNCESMNHKIKMFGDWKV